MQQLDTLSPATPARVRVLLVPVGQIRRARFTGFVDRVRPEYVVRLGDISPDGRPNRNMFSPLAAPTGVIIYDLLTHSPPPSHVALSPFELYREPLVVIAVADGTELDHVSYKDGAPAEQEQDAPESTTSRPARRLRELDQTLEDLRDQYPKALVHQLFLFDYVHDKSGAALPDGLVPIPPEAECKRTTMKTIMCDLSSLLLAEMTTLAKSIQALPTMESPSDSMTAKPSWTAVQGYASDRRNSQRSLQATDSRSDSPAGSADRSQVRMSMPAQLRAPQTDSTSSSPSVRPTTPMYGLGSDSATTPDEDTSERVSVQGFGSSSVSERSRSKGKSRIGIVIASLYLCAGRWSDALREFADNGTLAKNNLDHLWHAKALENTLVCMLMLAWRGADFQIPQLCYISSLNEPTNHTNDRSVTLSNLASLLPELLDRILNLYARSANHTGEALPQLAVSESAIRFSKLLTAIHLVGGVLNEDLLKALILGTPLRARPDLSAPRLSIHPTRSEIARLLYRAFPSQETLSIVDRATILGGIASVFGSLGYQRKKAVVTRELVSVLIPGLVQARIKDAAEMGVHPAAGLASLSSINGSLSGGGALTVGGAGDTEHGLDAFLSLLNSTYGVISSIPSKDGQPGENSQIDDSDDAAIARIVDDATTRSFGGLSQKMDVLRSCINLCEALPDFQGVLTFTSDLLRTAGSGIAPGPRSEDASPSIAREEQIRLATNISRTISAAKNLGIVGLAAEYWDEFLVRGVDLEALPPSKTPIPHTRNELPGATVSTIVAASREVNPFIYNPFLKAPDAAVVNNLLVAGEKAMFRVNLQNPYQFEVEIESIRLESEGIEFESSVQRTVIGAYRTQLLIFPGTPKSAGTLKITGCLIRVRGCRKRRFPIFVEPWSPQREVKIKTIGLGGLLKKSERPTSVGSAPIVAGLTIPPPKMKILELDVISRQPIVVVKSTSLSQSAMMVLEGERRVFTVTLQNLSKETPVDLILFSFKDSTQAPLQAAMSGRDVSSAELYEYELILARKGALRWIRTEDKPYIPAGGTATFELEVLGKPGLTGATIQIDYAHLGEQISEVQENFHTRQVSLPLTITVNASIEMLRLDTLPVTGSIPKMLWLDESLRELEAHKETAEEYCMVLFDLRNSWPRPLLVTLAVAESGTVTEEILPGNTSRIMFPVKRVFVEDPTAPIPTLDPLNQRQFVVSTGKITAESERLAREAFWFKEGILKLLTATWHTTSGSPRSGDVELRGIKLSPRMVDALRISDVGIDLSIADSSSASSTTLIQTTISTDTFVQLTVRITNRTLHPIQPILRIQPSTRNLASSSSSSSSLDLSKRLVLNGSLQRPLPRLSSKQSAVVVLGLTALCRGRFEIGASVEEALLLGAGGGGENGIVTGGEGSAGEHPGLVTRERRVWHSRQPLVVLVRDQLMDGEE